MIVDILVILAFSFAGLTVYNLLTMGGGTTAEDRMSSAFLAAVWMFLALLFVFSALVAMLFE